MKKFTIILAISLAALCTGASAVPSELNIRMHDHSLFTIRINGMDYNYFSTSFKIANLSPGKHYINVYRQRVKPRGAYGNMKEWVYSGYIYIDPATAVYAMIGPGRTLIITGKIGLYSAHSYPGTYPPDNNNGWEYHTGYMSHPDFMALKAIVGNTTFDNTKLSICKQAISSNYVSSAQLLELMNLLTFESNKLELAKFAFPYVVDANRYYLVNAGFSFSSSVSELNAYIAGM